MATIGTIGLSLLSALAFCAVIDVITYLIVGRDAPGGGGTSA